MSFDKYQSSNSVESNAYGIAEGGCMSHKFKDYVLTSDSDKNVIVDKGGLTSSIGELHKLGFRTPDLTGFDQEAPSKGGFWHGLKHLFVNDETNGDKVRQDVEKHMTDKERKSYEQEEKDMKDYRAKLLAYEVQCNINPGPPPQAPDCPMHDEVDRRVRQEERQIARNVEAHMSPEDRQRLHKQMREYEEACKEARTIHNPYGTGEGFKPMPKPGNAIKDYYDRIGEESERYVNR